LPINVIADLRDEFGEEKSGIQRMFDALKKVKALRNEFDANPCLPNTHFIVQVFLFSFAIKQNNTRNILIFLDDFELFFAFMMILLPDFFLF